MAFLSEEGIEAFKKSCAKSGIQYDTDAEYREAAQNLYNLAELMLDMYREERARQQKLKENPKGFAFSSGGRMCHLCGNGVRGDMYFDKWGMKCMDCQAALNKKIIPGYVFKDDKNERHITGSKLQYRYNLKHQTLKKLVRDGKLKARRISHEFGETLVFLKTDNPNLKQIVAEVNQGSP